MAQCWRVSGPPQGLFMFLVPVLVYVFMNTRLSVRCDSVNSSLAGLSTDTLRSQMRAVCLSGGASGRLWERLPL